MRVTQFNIVSELERRASEPPTLNELAVILTMERLLWARRFAQWNATGSSSSVAMVAAGRCN